MKKFTFKIEGNSYDVEVLQFEDQQAQIEVNGTKYDVELETPLKSATPKTPKLVRKPANLQDGESFMKKVSVGTGIKAPLPGVIIELNTKVGDAVKKGQKLLVMEAMKMNNDILAEKDGTVSKVNVSEGQSVMEGDLLIEVE
ncbi:MAG: biotin/lipoyl-containing protein [Bacteroidales bacterium]